jgi:hypothetical protein
MPAKLREAKERRPVFAPEVLELFRELELVPECDRQTQEFTEKSKRLSNLLNLNVEWWAGQHVEHSDRLCPSPRLAAHVYWHRVQRVREELLEATAVRH